MLQIGYKLSSEEFGPNDLVRYAARAEEAGFTFALISDHYHPWIDKQGQSPFVWCVIGGVAEATSKLQLGTAGRFARAGKSTQKLGRQRERARLRQRALVQRNLATGVADFRPEMLSVEGLQFSPGNEA